MRKIFIVILSLISISAAAQVTEKEKDLRKVNADTVQGWKKGGIFTLAFSQVSLTNWAAGGKIQLVETQ